MLINVPPIYISRLKTIFCCYTHPVLFHHGTFSLQKKNLLFSNILWHFVVIASTFVRSHSSTGEWIELTRVINIDMFYTSKKKWAESTGSCKEEKSLLNIIFVVHLHHTPTISSSFKLKLSEKSEMNRDAKARKPFCFFSAFYLMVNTCQAKNVFCKALSLDSIYFFCNFTVVMYISIESRLIEKDVLIYCALKVNATFHEIYFLHQSCCLIE